MAVDNDQNTMFLNPVAERMLDIQEKDFTGKPLLDIIRNRDAEKILRNILENYQGQSMGFELPWPMGRTIRVLFAPIRPKVKHSRTIGTLAIMYDITAIRKLEKVRSDFVEKLPMTQDPLRL